VTDDPGVTYGAGSEDFRQAEWLARKLKDRWKYDHTAKQWHHWNGVRWAPDQTNLIKRTVSELAVNGIGDAASDIERKALIRLLNLAPIDKSLEALSTFENYGTDGADWDQVPYLLGTKNGVVDLRYNALLPDVGPECLVTKTTGVPFKPVEGPDAFHTVAPLFMGFLDEIMSGDADMVSFLLLWFGASLHGFSPEQRFLLMTGIGRNGKGALKHSVMKAVGEYGVQPDANVYMRSRMGGTSSAGARADLMDLKGRRVGFFSEPEGNRFNEEMLKAHTGGDMITARALYSNRVISWEPTHSITFLVNNAPEVEDLGPSMGARVMVADFRERFDGDAEDKQLYRKLEAEAVGILAILCWAASAWYESWDRSGEGITLPERVKEQSRQFMERNDQVAAFLNEAAVLDAMAQTPSQRLYQAYQQWHARSDHEEDIFSATRFSQVLERKGFRKGRDMNSKYFVGIRPKPAVDLAEDEDE